MRRPWYLRVGALAEPTRRALYLYVAAQPDAVGREQAAASVGVPAHIAKFHLDRLVHEGLLDVEYRRLTGRSGPGAGRPAKLYRRSDREFSVSLPARRYDLAGEILAAAVHRSMRDGTPVAEAVREVARETGRQMAGEVATGGDDLERTSRVLARHGYEPRASTREICLANCPFDRLATQHAELVCGMNLDLIGGVVDGLGAHLTPELAPRPGFCCVRVRG
ncbi:helix-turn-helix transcriptional regulator [Pseudactinotalea sp. Z1732]|uniref:helix-turn-helix transcriptional regulator n=1 Tax=Micrococcales TaxID=85006 RepID=UPI003C7D6695